MKGGDVKWGGGNQLDGSDYIQCTMFVGTLLLLCRVVFLACVFLHHNRLLHKKWNKCDCKDSLTNQPPII